MWFAFALAVLGAAMELFPYVQSLLEPKFYGVTFFAIGIIVAILRFITTQPIER
jgi:hypothetical protein